MSRWKTKEKSKGAGQDYNGEFLPWFHGLINRKEAERLLKPRKVSPTAYLLLATTFRPLISLHCILSQLL